MKLMKRFLLIFFFLNSSLFGFDIQVHQPLYESGTQGSFIGATGNALIIAGGVRDQTIQSDIIVVERTKYASSRKYIRQNTCLPFPLAHGASISMDNGVLCLGGCNEQTCFNDAILLKWNSEKKYIEFATMPPLPFPLAHASATRIGKKIFLIGGVYDTQCQMPNRYLLELNLDSITNPQWVIRTCLPGPPRINAAIVAQSNGLRDALYVFGGQDPITKEPLDDGYIYDEKLAEWSTFGPIPSTAEDLFAAPSGANHIYINAETFFSYHTVTDTWTQIDSPNIEKMKGRPIVNQKDITYFGPSKDDSVIFFHTAKQSYTFGFLNSVILITYLFVLILIGLYFFLKKKQTPLQYFKGNMTIPWWAAGLSILGTEISTLNFLAVPAKAFASDWQYLVMDMTLILVIPLILYGFLPFFRRLQVTTAYEYLENRFNLTIRLIGAGIFIIFELLRIGIVLYLPAIALSFITGWSIPLCIISMGSLSVLYTTLGGIEAVIWTDVMQVAIFILAAILGIFFIVLDCQMNLSDIFAIAFEHDKIKIFDFALDLRRPTFWVILFSSISYDIVNYGADQATVQRYLTVKDEASARKSIWLNVILCAFMGGLFYFLGTALYVYYRKFPEMLDPGMQLTDNIFAHYIISRLPPGVSGILITGIFAAAMSTLDSSMNAIATTVSNDFYARLRKNKNDLSTVKIAKWTTLLVGVLGTSYSLFLSKFKIISFLDHYDITIAYTLCSVSGIFLLGILTKRANSRGVIIGLISSTIFIFFYHKYAHTHFLLLLTISTASTFIFGYIASLLSPEESPADNVYSKLVRKTQN